MPLHSELNPQTSLLVISCQVKTARGAASSQRLAPCRVIVK